MKKLDPERQEHGDYDDPLIMSIAFVLLFVGFCLSLFALTFY